MILAIGLPQPLPGARTFEGDPRDTDAVRAALADCEAIVYQPDTRDLDSVTRGAYVVATEAAKAGVRKIVLLSTLTFFARHPRNWRVDASWRPFPSPNTDEVGAWLAELALREVTRATDLRTVVIRRGAAMPVEWEEQARQETAKGQDSQAIREAVETAIMDALNAPLPDAQHGWRIQHIGQAAGRPDTDEGRDWREVLAPPAPIASRPIRRVAIFGAGGPIAAALARELSGDYELVLSDLRHLADVERENKPQDAGAPVARPPVSPHEERQADIRDFDAARAVCADVDAIINCSVLRHDPVEAFAVNTLGFHNLCRAAVQFGIRRVVQTGPQMITLHGENDYRWDYDVANDAPARPGRHLYGLSKFLGNEIGRVFAHWHGLEMPVLLYNHFSAPGILKHGGSPMMISYEDAARSLRAALEAPNLPSPYEEFHIAVDNPHQVCRMDKARLLLGWQAADLLRETWRADTLEEKPL